ncbi:MAG: tyrosine-type recombinase/integrase [Syntrophomonadales bacterium]|jgi:integrase
MIKKRGENTWWIRIYLGRGSDGTPQYYHETFYAPLKSMAQERERELTKQMKHVAGPKRDIMTLNDWLDRWIEDTADSVSHGTLRGYKAHLRQLKPLLGDLILWELDANKLHERLRGRFDHLKPKTKRNIYATLKTAIKAGIDQKIIPSDALTGFKMPKVPKENRSTLSREEIRLLMNTCDGYKHGLVIRLLCVTGARVSEILGLTWESVDLERGTITIDQSVDIKERRQKDDIKTANSRRTIELDVSTLQLLRLHHQSSKNTTVRPLQRKKSLVFQAQDGRPLRYEAIRKTLRLALKKAGLPLIRVHDIRHSVITLLLDEGTPPILVAALVGQDVATTVGRYAQKTRRGKAISFDG